MVFTTMPFVIFMTIVFFIYYLIPGKYQWILLLCASFFFYGYTNAYWLLFLTATIAVSYFSSSGMQKSYDKQETRLKSASGREEKKAIRAACQRERKFFLVLGILILLTMLFIFKYLNFAIQNLNALFSMIGSGSSFNTLNLVLPVGLSFYMFQSMGYMIDVYWGKVSAERNPAKYALFVSYFPQLLQGPIGDYGRLSQQLYTPHKFEYGKAVTGGKRILWGVFKKLVVANQLSLLLDPLFASPGNKRGISWLILLMLYSFQLYADFSGYMDIALGCSDLLGITMDENFSLPYFSRSMSEFWRRWHITLGAWFKNYVFYPLLRSKWLTHLRKKYIKKNKYLSSTLPTVIALAIVWLLLGVWHGADWSYVVYYIYHGTFIILAALLGPVYKRFNEKHARLVSSHGWHLFQIVRTFLIVSFGYSIFRPADLSVTKKILSNMFAGLYLPEVRYLFGGKERIFACAAIGIIILFIVDLDAYLGGHLRKKMDSSEKWKLVRWIGYTALGLIVIFLGAYGKSSLNQFAYFNF